MIVPIFSAYIEKGKGILKIRNREKFDLYCAGLRDGDYELILRRKMSKRSDQQNRWYWGVVLETIAQETENDKDQLHDVFKHKYLKTKIFIGKKEYESTRSTTALNKIEFGDYIERIRAEVADIGISIPDPDEAEQEVG